jgi:poly(3-hydroxybutyrate) depolymerase/peroxiredoxin
VAAASDGESLPRWQVEAGRFTFTFAGDTLSVPRLLWNATFSRPVAPANAIDVRLKSPDGGTVEVHGICARDGDRLTLCLATADSPPKNARPTEFDTKPGDGRMTFVLEKIPPGEARPETAAEQWGAIALAAEPGKLDAAALEAHAARCVGIAATVPGTDEATVCLLWALANAPDGPAGTAALAALKNGGIAAAPIETLALCLGVNRGTIGPGSIPDRLRLELAPLLLERVRRAPDHPKAAELVCEACCAPEGAVEVPPAFDEAARMIGARWTKNPDLTHFLEALSYHRQRPWAGRYESVVRAIATQTPDHYMRYRAAFTLARLVAEAEDRQEEARELFARFVADCKPELVHPGVTGLVEDMAEQAQRELDAMLVRGIGGPAPALEGVDLDGKPIALGDYRGKVVLLSFWATWCGPCVRLIPHERALAEQFKDRPFAVVGVNGDEIEKLDRKLIETHKITWRSFRNKTPDRKSISSEWNVIAWPTLYLIDHTGTIRRRWSGTPPPDELDHEIARWVAVAEGKPLAPALHPRAGAAPAEAIRGVPAKFIDKVYADEKGGEVKYVVCVPDGYDGKTPLPVVLFLHGSGQVGTDNRKQLEIGFGPAVRKSGMPFPFVGVFPQAKDGPWRVESPDGQRALAILGAVDREYATDPRRVYLTGVSMGGEGVWSLAAAHPKRFAAIVPVCGGGNPKHAAALKDVPCWAFHGDSDRIVPVGATRVTVRAITEAGGRPLYQEYRGVDHNCWDRVYAEAEMYHWLRAQVLK